VATQVRRAGSAARTTPAEQSREEPISRGCGTLQWGCTSPRTGCRPSLSGPNPPNNWVNCTVWFSPPNMSWPTTLRSTESDNRLDAVRNPRRFEVPGSLPTASRSPTYMNSKQAGRAHDDLGGRLMMPIQ